MDSEDSAGCFLLNQKTKKGMATQFSILGQRIPWPEEPGRLHSMRLQRVRHSWATNTQTRNKGQKREHTRTCAHRSYLEAIYDLYTYSFGQISVVRVYLTAEEFEKCS